MRTGAIAASLALYAAHAAIAQDAKEIVKKTNAVYSAAKTYQATFQMDMSMGTMGSVSQLIDIKMIPNQKASMTSKPNGKATGQFAMQAGQISTQMVDDGKFSYTYMPMMNQYLKRPHVAGTNNNGLSMMLPQLGNTKNDKATYKLLPASTINGKSAYAIEIGSANGTPFGGAIVVYIDKANYHLLQMNMNMSGSATQGQAMKMNMAVKNEKFNAPIPAGVFTFTPPKGATEMKNFGMGMGARPAPGKGQ
jgi:outer membrane lipoprotein-sorting protein